MLYPELLNAVLHPVPDGAPLVLDLFAGAGGLALGFEAQGFKTHGFELEPDCCETYRRNLVSECTQVRLTPDTPLPSASVIIGGPPCQPFSVGGKQLGLNDSRDGFPTFISAVDRLQPDVWLFENVRGILYRNRQYLSEILDALRALDYIVEFRMFNVMHYGVPQSRERIVVVGHRGNFTFPSPVPERVTAGDALGEMAFEAPPGSRFLTPSMDAYVARYETASHLKTPRDLHLNRPARTLTTRNLAGATGDMHRIRLPDGRRRRLLVHEAARLQSFPDWFEFTGSEQSRFTQIGNAVPPLFARALAGSVRDYLDSSGRLSRKVIRARNQQQVSAQPALL